MSEIYTTYDLLVLLQSVAVEGLGVGIMAAAGLMFLQIVVRGKKEPRR